MIFDVSCKPLGSDWLENDAPEKCDGFYENAGADFFQQIDFEVLDLESCLGGEAGATGGEEDKRSQIFLGREVSKTRSAKKSARKKQRVGIFHSDKERRRSLRLAGKMADKSDNGAEARAEVALGEEAGAGQSTLLEEKRSGELNEGESGERQRVKSPESKLEKVPEDRSVENAIVEQQQQTQVVIEKVETADIGMIAPGSANEALEGVVNSELEGEKADSAMGTLGKKMEVSGKSSDVVLEQENVSTVESSPVKDVVVDEETDVPESTNPANNGSEELEKQAETKSNEPVDSVSEKGTQEQMEEQTKKLADATLAGKEASQTEHEPDDTALKNEAPETPTEEQSEKPADTAVSENAALETPVEEQSEKPADTAEGLETQMAVQSEQPTDTAEGLGTQMAVQSEKPTDTADTNVLEKQHSGNPTNIAVEETQTDIQGVEVLMTIDTQAVDISNLDIKDQATAEQNEADVGTPKRGVQRRPVTRSESKKKQDAPEDTDLHSSEATGLHAPEEKAGRRRAKKTRVKNDAGTSGGSARATRSRSKAPINIEATKSGAKAEEPKAEETAVTRKPEAKKAKVGKAEATVTKAEKEAAKAHAEKGKSAATDAKAGKAAASKASKSRGGRAGKAVAVSTRKTRSASKMETSSLVIDLDEDDDETEVKVETPSNVKDEREELGRPRTRSAQKAAMGNAAKDDDLAGEKKTKKIKVEKSEAPGTKKTGRSKRKRGVPIDD